MLYQVGEYAYPGFNFVAYCVGFAIIVGALTGAYVVWKEYQ